MSDPTGLVTEERMERMIRVIAESPDSCEIGEQDGVLASELRALIRAARLVPVLMAECEAWRKWETKLWQDLDGIAKPQPPYLPGAMRDKTNAIATTDAALARAGVKL